MEFRESVALTATLVLILLSPLVGAWMFLCASGLIESLVKELELSGFVARFLVFPSKARRALAGICLIPIVLLFVLYGLNLPLVVLGFFTISAMSYLGNEVRLRREVSLRTSKRKDGRSLKAEII